MSNISFMYLPRSFVDGPVGCLHLSSVVSSAAVDMDGWATLPWGMGSASSSSRYVHRGRAGGHRSFVFICEKHPTILLQQLHHCVSAVDVFPSFFTSLPMHILSYLLGNTKRNLYETASHGTFSLSQCGFG